MPTDPLRGGGEGKQRLTRCARHLTASVDTLRGCVQGWLQAYQLLLKYLHLCTNVAHLGCLALTLPSTNACCRDGFRAWVMMVCESASLPKSPGL